MQGYGILKIANYTKLNLIFGRFQKVFGPTYLCMKVTGYRSRTLDKTNKQTNKHNLYCVLCNKYFRNWKCIIKSCSLLSRAVGGWRGVMGQVVIYIMPFDGESLLLNLHRDGGRSENMRGVRVEIWGHNLPPCLP